MAEITKNKLELPFSNEPLNLDEKNYTDFEVKFTYELQTTSNSNWNKGKTETHIVNEVNKYPMTKEGVEKLADDLSEALDMGKKAEIIANQDSGSMMKKWDNIPINREKLEKYISDKADKIAERAIDINEALASGILAPEEKVELTEELNSLQNGSTDKIADNDKFDNFADRLEQFMFERGEYDYSSDEHIRWLADANIPDDAGEREARECVMNHIKESLEDPDSLQHLINYLNDEIAVIDEEDESLHVADVLKTELEAVQSDYYTQVFSEMIEVMDFSLEKSYSREDNAAEYSLRDEQNANLGDIESDRFDNACGMIDRLDTYLNDYYLNDLEEEAEADGILNRETDAPETAEEWVGFMNENPEWKAAHKHEYDVVNMIAHHTDAVNIDKAWENFHTPQEIELCNKEIKKSIQEHDAWKNYGDVNFAEYGGTLVHPTQYNDEYEFFHLVVDAEGDKFAFRGAITDLHSYADEKCVIDMAQEFDITVDELLLYEPTRVAAELVERYGHGVVEFSPSNNVGTGRYSMDYNDFKVTDRELAKFMQEVGTPYEFIPEIEPLDLSEIHLDSDEATLEGDNAISFYIPLDDIESDVLQDAIERGGITGKEKCFRDLNLADVNVYLIVDVNETVQLQVSESGRTVNVPLSTEEKSGFIISVEDALGHTVKEEIEAMLVSAEEKNAVKSPKKQSDEITRD